MASNNPLSGTGGQTFIPDPEVVSSFNQLQAIQTRFDALTPQNALNPVERENLYNSFAENMGQQIAQGAISTWDALKTADDVLGDIDPDIAERVVSSAERASKAYVPPALKQTNALMKRASKEWDAAQTVQEKILTAAGIAWDTAKEMVRNPEGVAYLAGQSAPYSLPGLAGMVAGGATAGPGGALAGQFAGSAATESGAKLLQEITEEVQRRGLPMDEASVNHVTQDAAFMAEARKKAIAKGAVTAGVDTVLSAGFARLGTGGLQRQASAMVGELAGEPISEAAGQLAADGRIDAGELVGEFLGGVGSGPVQAPVNVAVYGVEEGVSRLREAARPKTAEEVQAKEMAAAPAAVDHTQKVEEAVAAKDIDKHATPEAEDYNPQVAAEAAAQINAQKDVPLETKISNEDKVQAIYKDVRSRLDATVEKMQENDASETPDEELGASLLSEFNSLMKVTQDLSSTVRGMREQIYTGEEALTQAKEIIATNTPEEVKNKILSAFGSNRSVDIEESAASVATDESATPEVREQAQHVLEYQEAEKSLEAVNSDVINGGPGFKGIRTYAKAIATALKQGNRGIAEKQLTGLQNFADGHKLKLQDITRPDAVNPQTGTRHAPQFVETVRREVTALDKATQMMSGWISTPAQVAAGQKAPTVAKAEGESRKAKAPVTRTKEKSPKLIKALQGIGFRDTQIAAMTPKQASFLGRFKDKSTDQIMSIAEGFPKDSIDRRLSLKAYEAAVRKLETQEAPSEAQIREKRILEKDKKVVLPEQEQEARRITREEAPKETARQRKIKEPESDKVKDRRTTPEKDTPVVQRVRAASTDVTTQSKADPENIIKNTFKDAGSLATRQERSDQKRAEAAARKTQRIARNVDSLVEATEDYDVPVIRNVLIEAKDFLSTLVPSKLKKLELITEAEARDPDTKAVLDSMARFTKQFRTHFDIVFKETTNKKFRRKDPVQYLLNDDGTMPIFVKDALAMAAWQWIAARSGETLFNDTATIAKLLQVPDDTPIPNWVSESMATIGTSATMLQEALGAEAYRLMDIVPTKDSPDAFQSDLETMLGTEILAILQSMNILKLNKVYIGQDGKSPYGLRGIAGYLTSKSRDAKNYIGIEQKPLLIPGNKTPKGTSSADYYRLIDNKNVNWITEPFRKSRTIWDKVMRGEESGKSYSWSKPRKYPETMKQKGTDFNASNIQVKNLQNNADRPYVASKSSMGMFLLMGPKNLRKILGTKDKNNVHITNQKGAEGKNRSIRMSLEKVNDWLYDAEKQQDGINSRFWIPQNFWRQGRMGRLGPINPQADKTHRFLFSLEEWDTTVRMDDADTLNIFLEAVALGMGLEAGKEGGPKQAIQKMESSIRKKPKLAGGITAAMRILREEGDFDKIDRETLLGTQDKYKNETLAITNAVNEAGEEMHSFKSIIEYARYLNAKQAGKDSFNTDITMEIDGVANGIAIGTTQLMGKNTNMARVLATLQNMGYRFSKNSPFLAEHLGRALSHDAYKAVGFRWANALEPIAKDLLERIQGTPPGQPKETLIKEYRAFLAARRMFGEFRDETGNVNKVVRKLSKAPTMRTTYGMGERALMRELQDSFIADIYTRMEDANTVEDIDSLAHDLRELTGQNIFPNNIIVNGKVNREVLLKTTLNDAALKQINFYIERHHGAALATAIDQVYGDMKEVFGSLNKGISVSAALYNAMSKMLFAKAEKQAKAEGREITRGEAQAIREKLLPLYPHVTSVHGNKVALTKKSREKKYSDKNPLEQVYKPKEITRKRAYPYKRQGVADPGVGGTIITIHHLDALIANAVMGAHGILNVHDGFFAGVGEAAEMGITANEAFFKYMEDFNMGEALTEAANGVRKEFGKMAKAEGLHPNLVRQNIAEELRAMKIYGVKDQDTEIKVSPDTTAKVMDVIFKDMRETGQVTKNNKAKVLDATVSVEQYSLTGSHYVTGNQAKAIKHDDETFKVTTITKESEKSLKESIAVTDDVVKDVIKLEIEEGFRTAESQILQSGPDVQMSIDPRDYDLQQEVNNMNVVETYESLKNESTVIDSTEHDTYLKGLLSSLVQKVMDPIELYIKNNPDHDTEGIMVNVEDGKGRVFITKNGRSIAPISGALNKGLRMSAGEVYAHELVHSVTHAGLESRPALRQRVESLFRYVREQLGDDGYKAFMNDPRSEDTEEIAAAKERFNYIFHNTQGRRVKRFGNGVDPATGIRREHEVSAHLDEFMALGLTNENFKNTLAEISTAGTVLAGGFSKRWKEATNIQEKMMVIFQTIADFVFEKFQSGKHFNTADAALYNLATLISARERETKGQIFETFRRLGEMQTALTSKSNELLKKALTKMPVTKTIYGLRKGVGIIKASDTMLGQKLREVELYYRRQDQSILKSISTEIAGRTDRLSSLYDLLHRRQIFLDMAKQQETDRYIHHALSLFNRDLDTQERISITKIGLKTDLTSLVPHLGLDGLEKVLTDQKAREAAYKALEDELTMDEMLSPYLTYYTQAADALGHFMVTARSRENEVVFQNPWLIAGLFNTEKEGKLLGKEVEKAEAIIDKMASLAALRYVDENQKERFIRLLKEDAEAINGVFQMHNILKENALNDSFGGNKSKFIKGYTKQILNSRIAFQYGTEEDADDLARAGYIREQKSIPRDPADPTSDTPFYAYVSRNTRINDLVSTILSFTSNRAKGTNSKTVAAKMDMTTSEGMLNNETVKDTKKIILNKMFTKQTPGRPGNYMNPAVDDNGQIIQYRYMMAEHTKDTYLEQQQDFSVILGAMAGQVVDKVRSPVINNELVVALKGIYDTEFQDNPGQFVEISPNSDDPRLREIFFMIPPAARKTIRKVWGSNAMLVSKDTVDLAFGYRNYSAIDAFTKDPAERAKLEKLLVGVATMFFKDKAVQRVSTIEELARTLTQYAKSNIIVKSLHVTLGNLGSNLIYLKSRGIPVGTILKLGWEAFNMGTKYQSDLKNLQQATLQRERIKGMPGMGQRRQELDAKILRYRDAVARNPVSPSIEAGLMPTLVDDVETVTSGEAFPTEFEKRIQAAAEKLPSLVQKVGKVALLTEDTQAFKVLNNAVKMTDFIGRHVLYNHYINQGMDHKKAVTAATEEFVNFNPPTHRMIEYANAVGALWFTKYGFRVLKVIKNSIVDKPIDVFLAYMLSHHTGLDNIMNSIPGVTKDFLTPVGDPLSSFVDSMDEPVVVNGVTALMP